MARPSEIETKTVSFRIPMQTYINLLQEASEKKLGMSEMLTLRVLSNKEEELKQTIEQIEFRLSDLESQLEMAQKLLDSKSKEVEYLKEQNAIKTKEYDNLYKSSNKEIKSLKNELLEALEALRDKTNLEHKLSSKLDYLSKELENYKQRLNNANNAIKEAYNKNIFGRPKEIPQY